ncbi:hypothetical protein GCM10027605_52430 [Micromonospora zhanjiangensis]
MPPHLTRAWGAVMTGVARRILRTWTEELTATEPPAFAQLPIRATVSGHDIAVAYGNPDQHDGGRPATLRLELDPAPDPDADSFLSLRPPAGHTGPPGRYFAAVCATLFGATGSDVRYTRPADAMATAIATARDRLPDIRDRFLADELPADAQLVVKYALPSDDGPEYVWATVTSWLDPDRILGSGANDATTDPAVRMGCPVMVNTDDVVDWAVLDGTGVVEGGWTQAVLDAG